MARNNVGNMDGLANTLGSDGGRAGSESATTPEDVSAHYLDIASLKAALQDEEDGDPTTYTDARLELMTRNDMIYALRLQRAATSIN